MAECPILDIVFITDTLESYWQDRGYEVTKQSFQIGPNNATS